MRTVKGILGLCFKLYIGVIFVATLLFFYPFLLITLSRKSWRRYSFPINVCWSFLFRILAFVHTRKVERHPLPEGPYMIVSNHSSYFDIFLMYSLLPQHRFLFMGKSEILSYPLVKTFFKRLNIPVFRNDRIKAGKAFIHARQEIAAGWSIVVFPEGGIPDDDTPQMIPFKIGAFKLAKNAKIPIVPITFIDNYHLFSDPGHILGPAHPGISRVAMHPVITVEQVKQLSEQELSDLTFKVIAQPLIERGLMKEGIGQSLKSQ